jgi:hypothetical protein
MARQRREGMESKMDKAPKRGEGEGMNKGMGDE